MQRKAIVWGETRGGNHKQVSDTILSVHWPIHSQVIRTLECCYYILSTTSNSHHSKGLWEYRARDQQVGRVSEEKLSMEVVANPGSLPETISRATLKQQMEQTILRGICRCIVHGSAHVPGNTLQHCLGSPLKKTTTTSPNLIQRCFFSLTSSNP